MLLMALNRIYLVCATNPGFTVLYQLFWFITGDISWPENVHNILYDSQINLLFSYLVN